MEFVISYKEEMINLVDKVGGFEWMIQKYEIDGVIVLKLDFALDIFIIIILKNLMSKELVFFLYYVYLFESLN